MIPPDKFRNKPEQTIPTVKKQRRGKLSGTLLAAGAAAIVSVYSIGYINTEADTSAPVQAEAPAANTAPAATSTPNITRAPATTRQRSGATATPVPSTNGGGTTQTAGYKDGTYVGSGTSRHGGMQVTVIISGGKITSAAVTTCQTRYPCSDVASLVTAVVSQQAVPANHVSGATDSSTAFKQAVAGALAKAESAA